MKYDKFIPFFLLLPLLFSLSCKELSGGKTFQGVSSLSPFRPDSSLEEGSVWTIAGREVTQIGKDLFLIHGAMDNGGSSSHHFQLHFTLNQGDHLSYYFFANAKLKKGLKIRFVQQERGLMMEISLRQKRHHYLLENLFLEGPIHLDLDLHNNHSNLHVLIWDHDNPNKSSEPGCSFDQGCLYNSEDFIFAQWEEVGRAHGMYWGVQGNVDHIRALEGPLRAITDV